MQLHLAEISRRGVFKALAAYAVASWILIEGASIIAPAFLLPDWTVATVTTIVILGALPVIFIAWRYNISREGIRRDTRHIPDHVDQYARRLSVLVVLALLGITATLWVNYFQAKKNLAVDTIAEAQLGAPEIGEDGRIHSIAVLPFDDFSPPPGRPFLADGIAESILHQLAQNPELLVTARKSSFYFRGKDATAAEIGRILGVQALLEGSVQVIGDRVRITSQLIRTSDQSHLWSNIYEDSLDNVFNVQDTIAHAVRDLVLVTKNSAIGHKNNDAAHPGVEAFELVQEAKVAAEEQTLEAIDRAIRLLRVAIDLSPDYADAFAVLSEVLRDKFFLLRRTKSETHYDLWLEAFEATQTALEIDPDHPLAILQEGMFSQAQGGGAGYQGAKERVAALAPNDPDVLVWLSVLALHSLNHTESRALLDRARAVEPSNFNVFLTHIDRICGKQPVTTILEAQLEHFPVSTTEANRARARANWCEGRYVESISLLARTYQVSSSPYDIFHLFLTLANLDHPPALQLVNAMHLAAPNMFTSRIYDNSVFMDHVARERNEIYRWQAMSSFSNWYHMPINYGLVQIQIGDYHSALAILDAAGKNWEAYFAFDEENLIQAQTILIFAYKAWLLAQLDRQEEASELATRLLGTLNEKQLGLYADTMGFLGDAPLLIMLLSGETARAMQWLSDAERYRWDHFQVVLSSPIYAEFRELAEVKEVLSRLVDRRSQTLEALEASGIKEVLEPQVLIAAMEAQAPPSKHHLAQIKLHRDKDIEGAGKLYTQLLAQNPNYEFVRESARIASMLGRAELAVKIWRLLEARGFVQDRGQHNLARALFYAGEWEESINLLKPLISVEARNASVHSWLGTIYAVHGMPEVGIEYIREDPHEARRLAGLAIANHELGLRDEALAAARRLEKVPYHTPHYRIAYVYAYLGEPDLAFEYLETAYRYGHRDLVFVSINPLFQNLHDDERWLPFLEKLGMSPAQVAEVEFDPLAVRNNRSD